MTTTTVEKAVTVGAGDAIIKVGGVAVRGRWSRLTATSFTAHTDGPGNPITLAPGRTWVALARNVAPAAVR